MRLGADGQPSAAAIRTYGNLFAAMPSLHVGWSTWSALAVWPLLRRTWAKVLWALYPVSIFFCIVVTANHWILDAVGGWVVLGLGYLCAVGLGRLLAPARAPGRRRGRPRDPRHRVVRERRELRQVLHLRHRRLRLQLLGVDQGEPGDAQREVGHPVEVLARGCTRGSVPSVVASAASGLTTPSRFTTVKRSLA